MVRKQTAHLQQSSETDEEAAHLQDTMAAWRQRTGKAIASMVLSATMTMAVTKAKIKQQRLQQGHASRPPCRWCTRCCDLAWKKERLRQAYFRLAATYAMVEVRRVVRCLHNREIRGTAARSSAKRHCSVVSAETVIAALMAGASARYTVKRTTGSAMMSALAAAACRTSAKGF